MSRLAFAFALVCGLGGSLAGCTNKLSGSLDVDGKTFQPNACRSLSPMGMLGVELEAESGARFRFHEKADGSGDAFYFAAGAKKGQHLGECVTLSIAKQHSTVNRVTNVMGKAVVDCADPAVKGTITFENCH